jgi:hypothetical protein
VAVVLLSIFTIAAGMLVAQGTQTSADNRARIGAAGLAQRELDLVAETVTESIHGAQSLFSPQTAINPHLSTELDSGDPDYAFTVDGDRYKVVRYAQYQAIGTGSTCDSGSVLTQFATLVKVTVTWEQMSAGTKPHVAYSLLPPHRGLAGEGISDKAVIAPKVKGKVADPEVWRPNMRLRLTGPGTSLEAVTDTNGCAVFVVTPPAGAAADYEVTLLGSEDGTPYVLPSGDGQPVWTEYAVKAGETRMGHEFEPYDRAASLTVKVTGADSTVLEVKLVPFGSGAGDDFKAPLEADGTAEFASLYPDTYMLQVGAAPPVSVTLLPGEHVEEAVVLP